MTKFVKTVGSSSTKTKATTTTNTTPVSTTGFKPESEKRLKKELHRQQRALEELKKLGPISKLIVLTARTRTPAKRPNELYFQAMRLVQCDVVPTGGFCKGSAYHYERDF